MSKTPDIPRDDSLITTIRGLRAPHTTTDDGWVQVGTADEFSPAFESGHDNADPPAPPVAFYLSDDGEVRLRGKIAAGGTPGTVIFTLPDGFRPAYSQTFVGALASGTDICTWQVDPDGKVWFVGEGWNPSAGSLGLAMFAPGSEGDFIRTIDGVVTWDSFAGTEPGDTVVAESSFGQASTPGTNETFSRSDHTHGTPVNPVTAHVAASDPHAQYQRESEKGAGNGYASLDSGGKLPNSELATGTPSGSKFLRDDRTWQEATSTDATPAATVESETTFGIAPDEGSSTNYAREDHTHGTPTNPVTAHVADADPHTQYQKESEKDQNNGYAGLNGSGRVPIARLASGTPDGTKFVRDDGTLATPAGGGGGGATPAGTVVTEEAFGQSSAVGSSAAYARADHTHGTPDDPIPDHIAESDPHTQYQKESEKDDPNGYVGIDGDGYVVKTVLGTGDPYTGVKWLSNDGWQEIAGVGGASAANWYAGTGDPDVDLGSNGDMYLRDDGEVFKKVSGAWVDQSVNLGGSGTSTKRSLLLPWKGTVPSATGERPTTHVVPPQGDGSSMSFDFSTAKLRIETPNASDREVEIEKSAGGGAFSGSVIATLTLPGGDYEVELTGLTGSVTSDDLLRINFTEVAGAGDEYSVQLLAMEP